MRIGKVMAQAMAFPLSPIFPLLSTIPNLIHVFSVHLMDCYFPDFWYYHTAEKQSKNVSISEILHILLMSVEMPSLQIFSDLLNSGDFVIK